MSGDPVWKYSLQSQLSHAGHLQHPCDNHDLRHGSSEETLPLLWFHHHRVINLSDSEEGSVPSVYFDLVNLKKVSR
jgi:hypothetical protein